MRVAVLVVLWVLLSPLWASLGRDSGSLKVSAQGGEPVQGAKENKEQGSQVQAEDKKPLTNADVIRMVKAGLAESTIVLSIQHSPAVFDTSPEALISLKRLGVTQKVLDAMLTAGSEKPTPPAGPPAQSPAHPEDAPTENKEIKGSTLDLHTIRKVLLETDWADDDNVRAQKVKAIQKHTCLKVVDAPEAADAVLGWSIENFTGASLELRSKDGQVIWDKTKELTPPLRALKEAVGCP
jgi:hypothetical protein